jgi:hypothetical protein
LLKIVAIADRIAGSLATAIVGVTQLNDIAGFAHSNCIPALMSVKYEEFAAI